MYYSWRFELAMILTAVIAAFAVMTSEYAFDASSAVLNIVLSLGLTFTALFGFTRRRRLPRVGSILVTTVVLVCGGIMLWALLFDSAHGSMSRAFTIAHMAVIIMACRFINAGKTRDYASLFVLTMLLMVVAMITCTSITLVPFFVIYMILSGYALIIYHLQRQVEIVVASRFIDRPPAPEEIQQIVKELKSFWSQLGHSRFTVTCSSVLGLAVALAAVVFFVFPRFEPGSLLGGQFGAKTQNGFTDHIQLGQIDKSSSLRQVMARVSISGENSTSDSEHRVLYLRCNALDQYWPCKLDANTSEIIPAQWTRSLLSYLLQQRLPDTEDSASSLPLMKQDILLGDWNSSYLPGIYPIYSISGMEEDSLRIGQLDQVVSVVRTPPAFINYSCLSFAQVNPTQSCAWFKKYLEKLEQFWIQYGTGASMEPVEMGRGFTGSDIGSLAREIAGDLAPKRPPLMSKYHSAFEKWRYYRYQRAASARPMISPWDVFRHENPDPNEIDDPKYQQYLTDVYDAAVQVGRLDCAISEKIADYLRQNYNYSLNSNVALAPDTLDYFDKNDTYDPIEVFLSKPGSASHCEIFASAMVNLCRALGLKARIAVGYQAHEYIPQFDYFLVRQRDAHSWVEVYSADQDWVLFDPTPPAAFETAARSGNNASLWERTSNYFENLQYRWLKFSASTQGRQTLVWASKTTDWLENLESSTKTLSDSTVAANFKNWFTHQAGENYFSLFIRWMIFFCLVLNIFIAVREIVTWLIPRFIQHRIRRRQLNIYGAQNILFYRRMLEILLKIHIYKPPAMTPREFAFQVVAYDQALAPVGRLSELYYKVRFGNAPLDDHMLQNIDVALNQLTIFAHSIRKTIKRPWAWEKKH